MVAAAWLTPESKLRASYLLLLAENQQLKRILDALQVRRHPGRSTFLKALYVALLEKFAFLKSQLFTVTPDTVFQLWKKQLARRWTFPASKRALGRPPISEEVKRLVIKMKKLNPRYGALHIEGEMKLLGIDICRESIRTILRNARKTGHIQTNGAWSEFLRSHWKSLFACDFLTVDTLAFKLCMCFSFSN